MKSRIVVSREYKVMLQPAKFAGSKTQLLAAARRLWADFDRAVGPIVFESNGALETMAKQRLIVYLDTDAQHLRASGYIFRLRRGLQGDQPEVTLKFRHPDRYVAQSRQTKSSIPAVAKFEEDIKPPFVSLYSLSMQGLVGRKPVPSTLKDACRLFPDLSKRLGDVDGRLSLNAVNGFTAREIVITGAKMRIGTTPRVAIECALIVWYDHNGSATDPLTVEFSYRYGDTRGEYGGKIARRAFDIFATLQSELTDWVDPASRTKTACVFG